MISAEIKRLLHAGEGARTEFKSGVESHESIAKTICAFLNGEGGVLICGVDDRGQVIGVKGDVDIERAKLELYLQGKITPKALFTLSIEEDRDASIIVVGVPVGRDRPYVFDGRILLRYGRQTRGAPAEQMRAMVQSKAAEAVRWERRPAANLEMDDLVSEEIRRLVRDVENNDRIAFSTPDDDLMVLRQLALYSPAGLTQGADVVFGENPDIRHPQCRIRLVRYANEKGGDYEDSRWFSGPLVKIFEEVAHAVLQGQRVAGSVGRGEDFRRRDQTNYSRLAVREGIINALAHRDYASFSGGVTVSVYPEKIEIWNSGRLPDGLKTADLKRKHQSIPTNPDIAHVLYLRGLMERNGEGTQRIVAECRAKGALAPRWDDRASGVTLTIYAGSLSSPKTAGLNHRQEALLNELAPGETIALGSYHQRFASEISDRQARRDLITLAEEGFLLQEGGGGATLYRRTGQAWP